MLYIKLIIIGVLFVMTGCASQLPTNTGIESYAKEAATNSQLAKYIHGLTSSRAEKTGVYTLGQGTDAFVSRISLINAATISIDLQYYIYNKDITGSQINHSLYQAAERGVRVRILLDDLKAPDDNPKLHILNQHKNVEIRLFNPSPNRRYKMLGFLADFDRLNSRMHNKSLTVDSLSSIVGGRNIGDEYFSASVDVDFGDFDLLLIGEATDDINTQFDDYWNSEYSYPLSDFIKKVYSEQQIVNILTDWEMDIANIENVKQDYIHALQNTQLIEYLKSGELPWYWGQADVLYDPPNKAGNKGSTGPLIDELKATFDNTQEHLFIISPYFVPGPLGTQYLIDTVKRGVSVTILTNSLAATDVVAVHSGYANYRKTLIEAGVDIYETKVNPEFKPNAWRGSTQTSLHAKSITFDKARTFVGSLNLDPRSVHINTEIGVLFDNQKLSETIVTAIKQGIKAGAYHVTIEHNKLIWHDLATGQKITSEPDASIWRKFGAWFIGFLPIEDQL